MNGWSRWERVGLVVLVLSLAAMVWQLYRLILRLLPLVLTP